MVDVLSLHDSHRAAPLSANGDVEPVSGPDDPIRWVDERRDLLSSHRRHRDTCVARVRLEDVGEVTVSVRPADLRSYMASAAPARPDGPFNSGDAVGAAVLAACRRLLGVRNVSLHRLDLWRFTAAPARGPDSKTRRAGVVVAAGAHECAVAAQPGPRGR